MSSPTVDHLDLSGDQRRQVEGWLAEFERGWDEKALAARAAQLPPPGDRRRLPLLGGLVRLDQAQQWRRGRRAVLEAYLKLYPELGTPETVDFALVRAEFELRQQFAPPADLDQLARRFPRQAEELLRRQRPAPPAGTLETGGDAGPPSTLPPPASPAPARREDATVPDRIGPYQILKRLGQGGMGTVYLARDGQLDRLVALKVPHFRPGAGPEVRQRFLREARAAAALLHPNLCPVHNVGEADGVLFVTMAYLEGKPLSDLLKGGKPQPQKASAAVARKLALALEAAHQKGVIHRDLKPANVMITKAHEPVVMDFGLARREAEGEPRLTHEGALMGTPAYMPPEQAAGDLKAIGPGCDVYSLGVILFEMLTGRLPFQGGVHEIIAQLLHRAPPRPSELRPGLDPALEAVCLKAMAKRPEERYRSMAELAAALTAYLQGKGSAPAEGVAAAPAVPQAVAFAAAPGAEPALAAEPVAAPPPLPPPSAEPGTATQLLQQLAARLEAAPPPSAPPRAPRAFGLWAAVAAVGVLVGVVVLAVLLLRQGEPAAPGPAPNPPATFTVNLGGIHQTYDNSVNFFLDAQPISREELRKQLKLPAGEHRLVVKRGDVEVEVRNFTVRPEDDGGRVNVPAPPEKDVDAPDSGELRRFLGHQHPVYAVDFLPDGRHFVSGGFNEDAHIGLILLWDKEKTAPIAALTRKEGTSKPFRLAVCPGDGRILTDWVDPNVGVFVVQWAIDWQGDAPTQRELPPRLEHQTPRGGGTFARVAVSADGRRGLTSLETNLTQLWDLDSGKELDRLEGNVVCFTPDGRRIVSAVGAALALWDAVPPVKERAKLGAHAAAVYDLACFPDGGRAVSASGDGTARIWDLSRRREPLELKGHTGPVTCVAVSPDGRRVLTGSSDTTMRLWDADTGKEIRKFAGHSNSVTGVAFSPGGRRALSSSTDMTIRLWQLPP
jgi:WD40 repeat protein/predicted Ser/Thr protein kinase